MKKFRHNGDNVERAPYHYTECGLDDIYLVSGYDADLTDDGEFVRVKNGDGLLTAIGLYLVTEKKQFSGRELRYLRRAMEYTQAVLGTLLRVTDQTVARWEKEEVEMAGPADFLVRLLYLEHLGLDRKVRDLTAELRERDESSSSMQVFKATGTGWKRQMAACG